MPHIHDLIDFTASGYVLHPTEPKICLLFHKKLNTWLQPGGHIELHENPVEALAHEMEEEIGFREHDYTLIEPVSQPQPQGSVTIPLPFHIDMHAINATHQHIDFGYVLKAHIATFTPQLGESTQLKWCTIDDMNAMVAEGTLRQSVAEICTWAITHYGH